MVFEVLADLSECLLNSQCYSLSGNVWTPSFLFGWHNIAGCWSASCYQPFGIVNQVLAYFQILKIQKPSTSLSTSVNCFQILKIQSLVNQVLSALVGFSVNGCLIVCTACWMLIVWKSDGFLKKNCNHIESIYVWFVLYQLVTQWSIRMIFIIDHGNM